MNAVARGADNLRHVRPHGIKTKTGKRPAIARAGNRDFRGLSLKPRRFDDVGFPVMVPEFFIFRIDGQAQDALRAILHAGKTPHALKKQRIHVTEIANVIRLLFVAVIDTGFFNAVMTPGAVFPPIHHAMFADARPPRRNRLGLDVIFFRHELLPVITVRLRPGSPAPMLPCRPKGCVSRANPRAP